MSSKTGICFERVENIVGKGENAVYMSIHFFSNKVFQKESLKVEMEW